ncbi:MAG: hypothetical protein H8K10_03835 [Nitrospira sp.]|nr:hypothetical protein [Nitrospira sp.]
MAWGPDANTEDELERLAAVRAYFEEQFPGSTIRDSYDVGRLAQVFRIEIDGTGGTGGLRDVVIATEFLDEHPPGEMLEALSGLQVADRLRSAKGREVLVTTWGVEEKEEDV